MTMIFRIEQTRTNFDAEWIAKSDGKQIAKADAPFIVQAFCCELAHGEKVERMVFEMKDLFSGKPIHESMRFYLYEDKNCIGWIGTAIKKESGLFSSYSYYDAVYRGEEYSAYEVGLGKDGIFLCIYQRDILVAMVEKEMTVTNFRDCYDCYLLHPEDAPFVMDLVVCYDASKYGDWTEVAAYSKKRYRLNTIQKKLLEKYDPEFIPNIKRMNK